MNKENLKREVKAFCLPEKFHEEIEKINIMPSEDLKAMLLNGKCPYPVQYLIDVPLGMFHCELCGTMVIAGLPHGPIDPPFTEKDFEDAKEN